MNTATDKRITNNDKKGEKMYNLNIPHLSTKKGLNKHYATIDTTNNQA